MLNLLHNRVTRSCLFEHVAQGPAICIWINIFCHYCSQFAIINESLRLLPLWILYAPWDKRILIGVRDTKVHPPLNHFLSKYPHMYHVTSLCHDSVIRSKTTRMHIHYNYETFSIEMHAHLQRIKLIRRDDAITRRRQRSTITTTTTTSWRTLITVRNSVTKSSCSLHGAHG